MTLQNRFSQIVCWAGLALALTVVPATWASPAVQQSGQAGSRAAMHSQSTRVDINTASADRLKSLPGIGDTYARRIIAGRPYSSKDQLVSRGILPRSVYDNVKNNLIAHHIRK
ncbi:MAG: helix-hairpin-helix domain-containing protein [Acidobacteriaceae bacterium]